MASFPFLYLFASWAIVKSEESFFHSMKTTQPKPIPNCLRKYRRARGLKQREAARILGLSDSSLVSRWEQGAQLPSTVNLFKLAAVYRTLVDALYIDVLRDIRAEVRRRERRILNREQHDSQTPSPQDAA